MTPGAGGGQRSMGLSSGPSRTMLEAVAEVTTLRPLYGGCHLCHPVPKLAYQRTDVRGIAPQCVLECTG